VPLLVMVAGPNGSGKSTLTEALRADKTVQLPALYINADEIAKAQGLDAAPAQQATAKLRERAIAERRDLMYETVMSHPSKVAELQHAKVAGYTVVVHFVATDDPAVNVQRVALRVAAGGHDVPSNKIHARHARTLALAPAALSHADDALVFDNSRRGAAGGLALQAKLQGGRLELLTTRPARWVATLAREVNDRASEIEQLTQLAKDEGLVLTQAPLNGAAVDGVMRKTAADHAQRFHVQHAPASRAWVIHDAALLKADVQVGQRYRIAYEEGVAQVQALGRGR
jgi:predicted ABC-type ATPase